MFGNMYIKAWHRAAHRCCSFRLDSLSVAGESALRSRNFADAACCRQV